eukprot:TRINITY_DN7030_c0_g1_i1.p1 TRINITY_DN7030_c0_g1~~TRINITY_DN7030_c0_g1_i1.p1  ORF type:complete len:313 (+),score=62.78 TRINITY_DN7030_c0_g1_i1:108-1046(+)
MLSDKFKENIVTIVAGVSSGVCSKFVEYPFDTIKVKLQTQGSNNLPVIYNSTWDCFKKVYQREGLHGLFRGVSAPVIGACVELGITFWSYGFTLDCINFAYGVSGSNKVLNREALSNWEVAFAGAGGGFFTSLLLCPVELLKCKMQVQANLLESVALGDVARSDVVIYRNIWHCMKHTFNTSGIKGLYRGYGSTLAREIPANMMWFVNYEVTKKTISPFIPYDLAVSMISGASAGIGYWTVGMPADRIKSIMQTESVGTNRSIDIIKEVMRTEGLKGFYRGYLPTVIRAMPSNAVIFSTYEITTKLLRSMLD